MKSVPRMPAFILLLATLVAAGPICADEAKIEHWTMNLYFENDLFSGTDEGYTNGARASWVSPDLQDYLEDPALPAWIRSINRRLTFFHQTREGLQRNVIFSVGQTLYTPQDRTRQDLIEDDRPYAAWLFLSMGYQTRNNRVLDTLEARFGIVGPAALGREAQEVIHQLRGIDRFRGWDNQLRNEPGVVFLWEHKVRHVHVYSEHSRFGFDMIGHTGIALGNVASYLNTGGELRIGWAIPDDFGTSAIRPGGDNSTPNSTWDPRRSFDRNWGAHVFISLDARLVGRDIFLDGNTFSSSHSVRKERIVGDAAVGFSLIYHRTKLSYAQIYRSKEFAAQKPAFSYGSLALSYTFR